MFEFAAKALNFKWYGLPVILMVYIIIGCRALIFGGITSSTNQEAVRNYGMLSHLCLRRFLLTCLSITLHAIQEVMTHPPVQTDDDEKTGREVISKCPHCHQKLAAKVVRLPLCKKFS